MNRTGCFGAWVESLESRRLMSNIPEMGGIGYFLSDGGTKFQRYDIANEKWLAPITLQNSPGVATATLVDSDGLYVAYDRAVYRYALDGSSPTHLINTSSTVLALHSDGNILFLNNSGGLYARFISFNKSTNTIIDTLENYVDSVFGSSISRTANKIFGRSEGISPSDITYASYDDNGTFTGGGDSPYHGDYPDATRTWVFPTGSKVVDDSGAVYSSSNLTRLNSFGTTIDDIAFVGDDVPIVLSGRKLTAYTSTILPAGSAPLKSAATDILVNDRHVIAFTPDVSSPNQYAVEIASLEDLDAPQPGEPIDPAGLAYEPDHIEKCADGTLLLLDKETQSIFRWNPQTESYTGTIALVDVPDFMAYSGATNTIYLAYNSGLINSLDLDASSLREEPFTVLPGPASGLSTAGEFVFAADGSGAWGTHYTFDSDGSIISAVDWNYYSTEYIWSAANSKMYFFRDDTSPNDLYWEPIDENGVIDAYAESPLHDSDGFDHPIRVSPDGKIVILGSGVVHDADTLERQTAGLANAVSDITWMKGTVYTVRSISGNAQFQQWTGPTFAPGAVSQVQGAPVALFTLANSKLVGIYLPASGIPAFRLMDASLQPLNQTPTPGSTPASIGITTPEASAAEGNSGATNLKFTVRRSGPTNGATSINWMVQGNGANPASPDDFVGGEFPSGTLNFAAGETTKTISVQLSGDTRVELNENLIVTLSAAAGGTQITAPTALGTIVNDDSSIRIAAVDAKKKESNSGTVAFTYKLTRSGLTAEAMTVDWNVTGHGDNPANAADFAGGVLPGGTITFNAGQTSRTLRVLVSGDSTVEMDDEFIITLSDPSDAAQLATPTAGGRIINDDTVLVLQSEAGAVKGGALRKSRYTHFSGTGYADYAGRGSYVRYVATREISGATKLAFRYANGAAETSVHQIYVNGAAVGSVSFAPTGGWKSWKSAFLDGVQIPAGNLTIKAVSSASGRDVNVDKLELSKGSTSGALALTAAEIPRAGTSPKIFADGATIDAFGTARSHQTLWQKLSLEQGNLPPGV